MLEIKFDVTTLSTEQRQDLASFILGFPGKISETVVIPAIETATIHDFSPESPPLPEGASAAPISAGVEVSLIAPEVIPETTSDNPIANIPPVPPNANAAGIAAPPQANRADLDSEGLPWDKRIHASTKTKIASGAWKLARGVEPTVVEAVKAELRGLMGVPVKGELMEFDNATLQKLRDSQIPTPPAPSVNFTEDLSGNAVPTPSIPKVLAGTTTIEEPVSSALISSVSPFSPPAPASHYLMTPIRHGFVDFIEDITKLLVSKKLAQPEIIKACNDAGVAAPNLLAARQDLIPQVAKALDTIVASRI